MSCESLLMSCESLDVSHRIIFFSDFHRCILQDRDLYELQHIPPLRRPGLWNSEDEILKQPRFSDINMSKRYGSLISSSDNASSCAATNSTLSQNTDIKCALRSADSAKASCAAGKVRASTAVAAMSSAVSAVSNLLQLWQL